MGGEQPGSDTWEMVRKRRAEEARKRQEMLRRGGYFAAQRENGQRRVQEGLIDEYKRQSEPLLEAEREYVERQNQRTADRSARWEGVRQRVGGALHRPPRESPPPAPRPPKRAPAGPEAPAPDEDAPPPNVFAIAKARFKNDPAKLQEALQFWEEELSDGRVHVIAWDQCRHCQDLERRTQYVYDDDGEVVAGFREHNGRIEPVPPDHPDFLPPQITSAFRFYKVFSDPANPRQLLPADSERLTPEQRAQAAKAVKMAEYTGIGSFPASIDACGNINIGVSGAQSIRDIVGRCSRTVLDDNPPPNPADAPPDE